MTLLMKRPGERKRIVCLGVLPSWAEEEISFRFDLQILETPAPETIFPALDSSVVAVISRSGARVSLEVIEAAPSLRVIARSGVGFDNIDVDAATRLGVPVVYTPGALSRPVAEHTLAMMLAATRDLAGWRKRLRRGGWEERNVRLHPDLEGATVGIVGFGRVGKEVRRLLQPFDVHLLVNDPYLDPTTFEGPRLRFVSLPELLAGSLIVTLHVPLTAETQGLIHSGNIDLFQKGAILVNTARGPVIESHRLLVEALDRGRLSYVGIDTPVIEPLPADDPLLGHPRAMMTAHVAGRTPLGQRRVLQTMIRETLTLLSGGRPDPANVVNPEVLDTGGEGEEKEEAK